MTAFDKHGERVEGLARLTEEEMLVARSTSLSDLHYWERAVSHREQREQAARKLYEEQMQHLKVEAEEAPARIERLKGWIEELDGRLAKMRVRVKPTLAQEASRQSQIDALTKRLLAGDVTAAEELKRLMK